MQCQHCRKQDCGVLRLIPYVISNVRGWKITGALPSALPLALALPLLAPT